MRISNRQNTFLLGLSQADCTWTGGCSAPCNAWCGGGGGGGGSYGGGPGGCSLDGVPVSCGSITGIGGLGSNGIGACPNNICNGFTNSGEYVQFVAGAGGVTGYVKFSDIMQGIYEANGTFMSGAQYDSYIQSTFANQIETEREALARSISAKSGGAISYQDAYDSLGVEGGHLQGGNYNFVETTYDSGDLTCGSDADRCGGVHFPASGFVHLDTTNPFAGDAGSFLAHGFVDLFLGNVFYTVIPRPWP